MADPSHDGPYACHADQRHGLMRSLEAPEISEGIVAYLCEQCGVWRFALPKADPRREQVERLMAVIVAALFAESA